MTLNASVKLSNPKNFKPSVSNFDRYKPANIDFSLNVSFFIYLRLFSSNRRDLFLPVRKILGMFARRIYQFPKTRHNLNLDFEVQAAPHQFRRRNPQILSYFFVRWPYSFY